MLSTCDMLSMQDCIFVQSMENPRSQGYVVVQPKLHQGRYDSWVLNLKCQVIW